LKNEILCIGLMETLPLLVFILLVRIIFFYFLFFILFFYYNKKTHQTKNTGTPIKYKKKIRKNTTKRRMLNNRSHRLLISHIIYKTLKILATYLSFQNLRSGPDWDLGRGS